MLEDYEGVMGVRVNGRDGNVMVYLKGTAKTANVLGSRGMASRVMCGVLKGQVTRTLSDVVAVAVADY